MGHPLPRTWRGWNRSNIFCGWGDGAQAPCNPLHNFTGCRGVCPEAVETPTNIQNLSWRGPGKMPGKLISGSVTDSLIFFKQLPWAGCKHRSKHWLGRLPPILVGPFHPMPSNTLSHFHSGSRSGTFSGPPFHRQTTASAQQPWLMKQSAMSKVDNFWSYNPFHWFNFRITWAW